jgi:hypothetical protein
MTRRTKKRPPTPLHDRKLLGMLAICGTLLLGFMLWVSG